jgi:hypothetical protein
MAVGSSSTRGKGRRSTWSLWSLIVSGLTLIALFPVAVVLAVGYIHANTTANAYAAAKPCTVSTRAGVDCVQRAAAEVTDARTGTAKSTTFYWLHIAWDGGTHDQWADLACADSESFSQKAQSGGELSALVWGNTVISLTDDGVVCETAANEPGATARLWLIGLGADGSLAVTCIAILIMLVTRGRGAMSLGLLIVPALLSILILPVLLFALDSHNALVYLLAYAIGVVIELPVVMVHRYKARRKALGVGGSRNGRTTSS